MLKAGSLFVARLVLEVAIMIPMEAPLVQAVMGRGFRLSVLQNTKILSICTKTFIKIIGKLNLREKINKIMSMYNLVNGINQIAVFFFLPMLGKNPDQYPRFRDAQVDSDKERIHVFTRVGGNNRERYLAEIEEMRQDPNYVTDYDFEKDSTYATFEFSVPKEFINDFKLIIKNEGDMTETSEDYKKIVLKVFPKIADQLTKLLYK